MRLPSWNRYPDRFTLVLLAVGLLLLAVELINGRLWLNDFRVYYGAANALLHGEPLYGVAHGLDSGIFKYAPFMAVLFVPFALLPYTLASTLFYMIILGAFIAAVLRADKLIRQHLLHGKASQYAVLFLTALISIVHLHRELHLGNINVILLVALLLALEWLVQHRAVLAGIVLGVVVMAKPHFVVLLPLLLLHREFRATITALVTALVCVGVPAFFLGFARTVELHAQWFSEMAKHNAVLIYTSGSERNAINTVYSFLHRAFIDLFSPQPFSMEPLVILGIIAVAFGFFVVRNLRRSSIKSDSSGFVFAYLWLLALVPSITLTDTEHFLFALPLVAFIVHGLMSSSRPQWLLWLAIPILFGYGGNWEDALGPLSDIMIHCGVLGIANLGLLSLSIYLFLRDRSNAVSSSVSNTRSTSP